MMIKVEDLKQGDGFKWKSSQRNFRFVRNVCELKEHDHIAPVGRKICVTYDNCRQFTALKGFEVILRDE